jgi:hypothetical protein
MRSPDALERLAAARPELPGSLADAGEEEQILAGILASRRTPPRAQRLRRATLVLAGVVLLAVAAAFAALALGHGKRPVTARGGGQHAVTLTGARIRLAGYHFRTPAGFKPSSSCLSAPVAGQPRPSIDGFAAAATAEGACVEAVDLVAGDWLQAHGLMPDASDAVDVGDYAGYFVPPQSAEDPSTLYVNLPGADGRRVVFLVLRSRGLTESQLIAVALSGLPTLPSLGPTTTTGTEATG